MNQHIQILAATTTEHFVEVRNLMQEFVKWHLQRPSEDAELIGQYFDPRSCDNELSDLASIRCLVERCFWHFMITGPPVVQHYVKSTNRHVK